MGRIIIVSGPPGAGKTTVAGRLSRGTAASHSLHLHTDDLYAGVRKGFIEPWRTEATNQNLVLINALAATAAVCAKGGYEVYADGVVGPWFLQPWANAAQAQGLDLHYVVLMPDEATASARATGRTHQGAMRDATTAQLMWRRFAGQEIPPACRVDSSGQSIDETVAMVAAGLGAGRFQIA